NIYGFTEAELLSHGALEFIHPDDHEIVLKDINKPAGDYNKTHTVRWRRFHKNGHYVWLETKSKYVLDEHKKPIEIVCATRNITDVKRAEDALEISENRFKILVQNSTDIFSIIDSQGQLLYINPAFYKITGYTESDVINKSLFNFLHPEDVQLVRDYFKEELENPDISQLYTYRFRIADGNYRYFETRGSSKLDDTTVQSFVLSTRDITDRLESQELIAFQDKNIKSLSESTIGYLNLSVDDDHFSYIGNQLTNLLPNAMIITNEYSSDMNKLICRNIIGLDRINKVLARYSNQIAEGSHFQPTDEALDSLKQAKLIQVEGGLYQLLFRTYPKRICNYVEEAAGIEGIYSMGLAWNNRLYGNVVIIVFDETPSINKEVVETFISVASVALQRKRTEDLVIRSLREKEVMLKEIHHRVKNNLQIVSSLLELQALQINDPNTKLLFEDSQSRVRSMALVHERIYKSQDLANINYREYLEELVQYLFESFQSDKVKLKITADNVMMSIDAAVPLGIIINELVTNSLKYAFPNGRAGTISVGLSRIDDRITLIIEDNGIGLPKHIRVGKHPTLGLELVNALTLQLNASIETDTSNGTKYTIELTC
ncbi:MAG: PAS domain S-box protein, partial [Balneolales bacterium]|nr:PAS domain S-box protein [Balneolales bacterium]